MPIKITVPGSKSISNRVLMLAALSNLETKVFNLAKSTDCKYMIKALEDLKNKNEIYTHNAGTTTRFILALASLLEKSITIDGDARMRERPIAILEQALNSLGAKIKSSNGCVPVKIDPQKPSGGEISLPGDISSQYISALLMIGPMLAKGIKISITNELCSKPYIEMTIKIMEQFGATVENKNYKVLTVKAQKLKAPKEYLVESDASSASYIAAYAALHPNKEILIKNLKRNSLQGDIKFLDYLSEMGCKIKESKIGITIKGPKKLLSLGEVDMNETPDLVMTFAVLAIFTDGKTKIKNIKNLKIKETDRLEALKNELKRLGVKVQIGEDYIEIIGTKKLKPNVEIKTYNDHRMAMCFAIARDLIIGLTIENPQCVEKSYATFWEDLTKLENEN